MSTVADLGLPGYGQQSKLKTYPDPFMAHSTLLFPTSLAEVWRWSEIVWIRQGVCASALRTVAAYFVTEPVVHQTKADAKETETTGDKQTVQELLTKSLNIHDEAMSAAVDFLAYGNVFVTIHIPFTRFLQCEKCKCLININKCRDAKVVHNHRSSYSKQDEHDVGIDWTCRGHNCGHKNKCSQPLDQKVDDPRRSNIRRWPCKDMRMLYNRASGQYRYFWQPPPTERQKVTGPDADFYLESYPWDLIRTIMSPNGSLFEFDEGTIFHAKSTGLSGFESGGWGMPLMLNNFALAYYVQLMSSMDEVTAHEYLMPFRMLSPPPATGGPDDPVNLTGRGKFMGHMRRVLNEHRRNPGGFYTSPLPVNYQQFGGEGQNMNGWERIGAAQDALLTAIGVPPDFFKMSLQQATAPTTIRIFQNKWSYLVRMLNSMLEFINDQIVENFAVPKCTAYWKPVMLADDLDKRNVLLNLMGANRVSPDTALSLFNLDAEDELRKTYESRALADKLEADYQQQAQHEKQMEDTMLNSSAQAQAQAQQPPGGAPGGAPQGGAPPGGAPPQQQGAGGAPQQGKDPVAALGPQPTPQQVTNAADQVADQWLAIKDDGQRRTEMMNMKSKNEAVYSAAKAKMDEKRGKARSQGQQQMQAQASGQGK